MQVERCTSVVSFLQIVDKASRLLLSKLDVITAASPLPVVVSFWLFSCLAAPASGYSVLSALQGEFVSNGGCADGVKESCFSGGCSKTGNAYY